jgi:AI-2 transport protein TqsA
VIALGAHHPAPDHAQVTGADPRSGVIGRALDVRDAGPARIVTGIAAALALLTLLRGIVVPLFIALLLMVLIDGQVRGLRRLWPKAPDWTLSAIAVALVIASLGACAMLLVFGVSGLVADAPLLATRVDGLLGDLSRAFGVAPVRINGLVDQGALMAMVTPAVSSISNLFAGATLTVLFLGFMLASRQTLAMKIASLARTQAGADRLRSVVDRIGQGAGTYMWVQAVTGAIYAGASGAVLYCIGLDNVPFWTVLIFLLSYIPGLGVVFASALPALFALIQFPTYWQAGVAFVAVQLLAFVVGNVVLPKMQADSQNIDPTVAIFSVALWTLLWGVPGAFLAIPLTVMTMIVFAQFETTRWAAVLISDDGVPEGDARQSRGGRKHSGATRAKPETVEVPLCSRT